MSASVNPMHQFELKNFVNISVFGYNFSITNGVIAMFSAVLFVFIIGVLLKRYNKIIPNKFQSSIEMSLSLIKGVCYGTLGEHVVARNLDFGAAHLLGEIHRHRAR